MACSTVELSLISNDHRAAHGQQRHPPPREGHTPTPGWRHTMHDTRTTVRPTHPTDVRLTGACAEGAPDRLKGGIADYDTQKPRRSKVKGRQRGRCVSESRVQGQDIDRSPRWPPAKMIGRCFLAGRERTLARRLVRSLRVPTFPGSVRARFRLVGGGQRSSNTAHARLDFATGSTRG
jgi:hypothetical protein